MSGEIVVEKVVRRMRTSRPQRWVWSIELRMERSKGLIRIDGVLRVGTATRKCSGSGFTV